MRQTILIVGFLLAACQASPPAALQHPHSNGDDDDDDDSSASTARSGVAQAGDDDDDDDDDSAPSNHHPKSNGGADAGQQATNPSDTQTATTTSSCKVSFQKDVLTGLDSAGCTSRVCHGSLLAQSIPIDASDVDGTYSQLTSFALGGMPYVKAGATKPDASAIHCNLSGTCGQAMPPIGGVPSGLLAIVDAWLSCGAPEN